MIDDPTPRREPAPEATNREQLDEESQAHQISEDAQNARPIADSVKNAGRQPTDDAQDVLDHMRQMERSGQIDMDAYRGERSDDDEEGELGPAGIEDPQPRGAP